MAAMSQAAPLFQGMCLTSWNSASLTSPLCLQSIQRMAQDGVDTVSLNIWEFQDNLYTTTIGPRFDMYSSDEASVRYAIRSIKAQGQRVLLKPNLDPADGQWRAYIPATDAWFEAYRSFILRYADIAQQEGVEVLCIGAEFSATQSSAAKWRSIAADVRTHFAGKLTYSSNYDCWNQITWWDAVDYIGIAAYYELTTKTNPSATDLKKSWTTIATGIENWLKTNRPGQKVLFTEAGYRSVDGAAATPWLWGTGGVFDQREQADCYKALMTTLWNKTWWGGVFWWNWETNPNAGGSGDINYTPQNKQAETVLRSYYNG